MNPPGEPNSGPDAISMIASVGAPLFVVAMLLYRIVNGHWESVAFVGLIFLVVLVAYVRCFWHDNLDYTDIPTEDAGITSSEVDNPSIEYQSCNMLFTQGRLFGNVSSSW